MTKLSEAIAILEERHSHGGIGHSCDSGEALRIIRQQQRMIERARDFLQWQHSITSEAVVGKTTYKAITALVESLSPDQPLEEL